MEAKDQIDEQPEREDADEDQAREVTPRGLEVRTPRRGEFFQNLKKVIKPDQE